MFISPDRECMGSGGSRLFPTEWAPTRLGGGEGGETPTYYLAKFSSKLHENKENSNYLFQSCIIKRYCEKRFVHKYLATIGIDYGVTK